jgi:hypothetical protein
LLVEVEVLHQEVEEVVLVVIELPQEPLVEALLLSQH